MLYLEDYLELIEHLPQELRDRLTLIRENDLKVNNSSLHIDTNVRRFFAEAKRLNPEQKQCNYEQILKDYENILKHADDKIHIASQTQEIMMKLIQKLDGELEKFKLELEADHAGITEELERRSLELDADMRLDNTINGYLNQSTSSNSNSISLTPHHDQQRQQSSSVIKDRRRSEHRQHQRHHPFHTNNHHQDNGYHVRAKLSHNHDDLYNTSTPNHNNKQMPHHPHHHNHFNNRVGRPPHHHFNNVSRQNSTTTSPLPYGVSSSTSTPTGSMANGNHMIVNGIEMNNGYPNNTHNSNTNNNPTSFGNNPGFRSSHNKNNNLPPYNQQHSALSAALSSATTPSPHTMSTLAMMNSSSVHNNKISSNGTNLKGADLIDPNDPLAAAASQAIAATQQLQQGRRTPSLKASYEAIKAGLSHLDPLGYNNKQESFAGRNALAPMAPDQQAFRYNQQYGKMSSTGASSPLYVSVTKSGRPSKRPKHHASHLYPDESPTSIRLDDSVFENSESLSSTEFFSGASPVFGSSSPSSIDFNNSRVGDQGAGGGGGGGAYYQRDETLYCMCRQISYGEMIACDNEECEIEWFHYGCVGITQTPKGKWYCPDCIKSMSLQNNNNAQTQTHKKRGRKEKSVFNMVDNSLDTHQVESKDRVNVTEPSKGVV